MIKYAQQDNMPNRLHNKFVNYATQCVIHAQALLKRIVQAVLITDFYGTNNVYLIVLLGISVKIIQINALHVMQLVSVATIVLFKINAFLVILEDIFIRTNAYCNVLMDILEIIFKIHVSSAIVLVNLF